MSAIILDGKHVSKLIEEELKKRLSVIAAKRADSPFKLATILVGDDPASATYVKMKGNACRRIGLDPVLFHLPHATTTEELLEVIDALNRDPDVYGILLQHPVSAHIDERKCFDRISTSKDTDGVTADGFGRMSLGDSAFGSATPAGIMNLLEYYNIDLSGMNAVVVGRSPILGKPMAAMLVNSNATVTICHSRTKDLRLHVGNAQLIVAAVGKPGFIQAKWIPDGAVVIDAGYHLGGFGDIALDDDIGRWAAYTPVPGGVGPMTIATLLKHTVEALEKVHSEI